MLHAALRGQQHNVNQTLNSQETSPYLTLTGELWGAYFCNFEEN